MDAGPLPRSERIPARARRPTDGFAQALPALLVWLLVSLLVATPAAATPPARPAATAPEPTFAPYMGVDTWYAYGTSIDRQTIVNLVNATVRRGLSRAGYRYIWLDAGWWNGQRTSRGRILLDRPQWPGGMAWLTHYIHAHGLRAGIYTDMGSFACGNGGSLGHFQQDVNQFAAWGFDAVKADWCGAGAAGLPPDPRTYFTRFARAIQHDVPHRRMILNVCDANPSNRIPAQSAMNSWAWARTLAVSWRTYADLSWPNGINWSTLLRNIRFDARHPAAAGSGHWNDPDYLAPSKLPPAQARAQLTMWIILAAPLMVSADVGLLSRSNIRMLTNHQALAISQDRLGRQGTPVYRSGNLQVWVKPLADGSRAVAVLNRGTRTGSISFTGQLIGLAGRRFTVREVWQERTVLRRAAMRFRLGGTSAVLLRISRG